MNETETKKEKMGTKEVFKILGRLYWMTKEHFGWGFLRMIGGYASAGIGVFSSWLMGTIVDVAISGDMKRFANFAMLVALQFFMRGFINFINPLTGRRYSLYSGKKIRSLAVDKVNKLPISYYETKHTGEVVSRLANDIDSLQEFYGNSIAGQWSFVPFMLVSSIWLLLSIDVWLTLICSVVIPLIWFAINKVMVPIGEASKEKQKYIAEYNSYLRDFLEGIHIYISYNMKRIFAKKFKKACLNEYKQSLDISRRQSRGISMNILSFIIPQVLAYGIGGVFVARGRLTIGQLVIFTNVIFPFLNSIRQTSEMWSENIKSAGKAKHLFELLDTESERDTGKDFSSPVENKIIEFKSTGFSYVEDIPVIKNLNFEMQKGSKTALVGGSGSGKTTVHKLILGYYDDYEGDIYFLNKEISRWNLESLRDNVAVVTQEVYLFCDSIMENIRFGKPDATDKEVVNAAKAAYADDFIMEFSDGYSCMVGERGTKLSGGQKQRIAIARAILKDAPVLLLDEPTSALDTKAEYYVQKALEKLEEGKTVFVIAHRLSTIENADNIIVLEGGEIIESGTHNELVKMGGRYIELYKQQIADRNREVAV